MGRQQVLEDERQAILADLAAGWELVVEVTRATTFDEWVTLRSGRIVKSVGGLAFFRMATQGDLKLARTRTAERSEYVRRVRP